MPARTRRNLLFPIALFYAMSLNAAPPDFLLGVQSSAPIGSFSLDFVRNVAITTDSRGFIYVLTGAENGQFEYLDKLSPDNGQLIYQVTVPFQASLMALDPANNIYLAQSGSGAIYKLAAGGQTQVYKIALPSDLLILAMAVDTAGRVYATGMGANDNAFVARLTAAGAADYVTYFGGIGTTASPAGIAVDNSGAAFVTGTVLPTSWMPFPTTAGAYLTTPSTSGFTPFLARLSPAGALAYSTFIDAPGAYGSTAVALDAQDYAVVTIWNGAPSAQPNSVTVVKRFNPTLSAELYSQSLPATTPEGLALDSQGNAYVLLAPFANYPVLNSLATCQQGTSALSVLDVNGNILQSTYIPQPQYEYGSWAPAIAVAPDATVDIPIFAPPAYQASGPLSLLVLSRNSNASTIQLACIGHAASNNNSQFAPGEIVSLFGNGLGPATAAAPQVTAQSAFPKQFENVQVTVNGLPAPLLYVADNQVNAVVPWAVPTGQNAAVCVTYNEVSTNCLNEPFAVQAIGLFTWDGYYAVAINQDGSVNCASHPAKVGSQVAIFGTGFGPLAPPQQDGAIVHAPWPAESIDIGMYWATFQPVQLGSTQETEHPIALDYFGNALESVAGLTQINFTVPQGSSGAFYIYSGLTPYPDFYDVTFGISIATQ